MENKTFKIGKSNIFHRRLDYQYPVITHGKGIYLYDESGRRYIDAVGGALVVNLGHGIKAIAQKIGKLAEKVSYLHGAQFTTRLMESYAEKLCQITPEGLEKVYFVSSGSEAVETAIKLSRQYFFDSGKKDKYKIIFTWPSYHGATLGALSVTGKDSAREIYRPYLLNFPHIPACFCYHCRYQKTYPSCKIECAWELERTVKKIGAENVAAFIVEPIIGASAGAVAPVAEYLPIIRKICSKFNILLIFDEVMSGFGRTGKWFACQHYDVVPDILVCGKGLSGGLVPLGAIFCKNKIFKTIKEGSGKFVHGFTFVNNPLTIGVGESVLSHIKKNNLVSQCAQRGEYLLSKLRDFNKFEIIGDVRGKGLMTAVEFVKNKKTKEPFPRKTYLAEKFLQAAQKKGLMLYFCTGFIDNLNGDAVMVGPPFSVSKREIDEIVNIFSATVTEVQKSR